MIDIRQFDPMRRPLDEASHAPGWLYSSPEVYRLEVEQLFMRSWLFVGREEEVPAAGDYLTLRIAGEPVVVARTPEGTLNATVSFDLTTSAQHRYEHCSMPQCDRLRLTASVPGAIVGAADSD